MVRREQRTITATVPSSDNGKVNILKKKKLILYKITHVLYNLTSSACSVNLHKAEPTGIFGADENAKNILTGAYCNSGRPVGITNNMYGTPIYCRELWANVNVAGLTGKFIVHYEPIDLKIFEERG